MEPLGIEWASGLFEGEGSISCYKIKNRANSYRVTCSISMTDKDVLDSFVKIIKVGKVKGPYKPQREGYKERFVWEVQNFSECLYVCEELLPYLHSRRKQKAIEMINLCTEKIDGSKET